MKSIHALALGLAFTLAGMPAAARQAADAHSHPPTDSAKPASAEAPPGPGRHAAAGKPVSGMGCEHEMHEMHEMHEKMMKRMEHMETMKEKMHGATAAQGAAKPKSEGENGQHEQHH